MMKEPFGGILLNIAFRILVPFSIVYAIYALILGELSPGGGFQAGVVLAFGIVLARLVLGSNEKVFNIKLENTLALAGIGTFIYVFAGWTTLFGGGQFLDYGFLPITMGTTHAMHGLGILIIEVGVTVCVMMTILNIMDVIVRRSDD